MVMRPRFGPRGRSNRLLVLLFLALGCGGALLYHFESRGTMGKGLVTSLMRMECECHVLYQVGPVQHEGHSEWCAQVAMCSA
jgi:hypothetical protein